MDHTHLLLLDLINIPRNIHSIEIHFGNPSNRLIKEKNTKKEWFAKRMTQNQKINLEVKRPESTRATPPVTAERPTSSAPAQGADHTARRFSGRKVWPSSEQGSSVDRRSLSCWSSGRTVPKAGTSLPPRLDQSRSLWSVNCPGRGAPALRESEG